jgi:hypothetical protein
MLYLRDNRVFVFLARFNRNVKARAYSFVLSTGVAEPEGMNLWAAHAAAGLLIPFQKSKRHSDRVG